RHPALHDPGPQLRLHVRQLRPRVDAGELLRRACPYGLDSEPGAGREAHHVGEVELALRVVRLELGEETEEHLRAGGVETWVDLGDGTLDVARVPLFDDTGDLAVRSADDSAIARGPCEMERHERQVHAGGAVGVEQGAERGG